MSRGAKTSVKTTSKMMSKEDKAIRVEIEETLKGAEISRKPPTSLNNRQGDIYVWLYDNLAPAQILSQLDIVTITNACIIIERLEKIDEALENQDAFLMDKSLHAMRKDYFSQYLKICAELCLSPASRAKMGTLAVNAKRAKEDDLLKALGGD